MSATWGPAELGEDAKHLVRALAEKHGENSDQVLQDLTRMRPAARLLARLLGLRVPTWRSGRPTDDDQFKAIYFTINELLKTMTPAQAYKAAPALLERKGITGPRGRRLTVKTMRTVHSHENVARAWFDPSAVPPETE